ncbi:hypothetical protein AA313_de0200712 [Arthrobotrys entomopaga]|nr:hypothetical protein AA313_de0200712 [Arthrobotrys entomopaga]
MEIKIKIKIKSRNECKQSIHRHVATTVAGPKLVLQYEIACLVGWDRMACGFFVKRNWTESCEVLGELGFGTKLSRAGCKVLCFLDGDCLAAVVCHWLAVVSNGRTPFPLPFPLFLPLLFW